MSAEVVKFYPANAAKNPDAVLELAVGVYQHVIVLGWDKDGELDARASLGLTREQIVFLLEQFKLSVLTGDKGDD